MFYYNFFAQQKKKNVNFDLNSILIQNQNWILIQNQFYKKKIINAKDKWTRIELNLKLNELINFELNLINSKLIQKFNL